MVRDMALRAGAVSVVRSAGSGGLFDLVVDFRRASLRLQVKANAWPGSVEVARLRLAAACLPHAIVGAVRVDDGGAGKPASASLRRYGAEGQAESDLEDYLCKCKEYK